MSSDSKTPNAPTQEKELEGPSIRPAPPLRIHHFLSWITATAVLLAISRTNVDAWQRYKPNVHIQSDVIGWAARYVALGGEATILLCVIAWWWRGALRRIQPGEWIAIIGAAEGLTTLLQITVYTFLHTHGEESASSWNEWLDKIVMCLYLLWFLVLVMLVVRPRENLFWRIVYILLTIERGSLLLTPVLWLTSSATIFMKVENLYTWMSTYYFYVHSTLVPAVCVAAYSDRAQKCERRWTHWLGVGLYIAQAVFIWAMAIVGAF